jgi:hypothetical protein
MSPQSLIQRLKDEAMRTRSDVPLFNLKSTFRAPSNPHSTLVPLLGGEPVYPGDILAMFEFYEQELAQAKSRYGWRSNE